VWAVVAIAATAFLLVEGPRDAQHWLLVLLVVISTALAAYSWKDK